VSHASWRSRNYEQLKMGVNRADGNTHRLLDGAVSKIAVPIAPENEYTVQVGLASFDSDIQHSTSVAQGLQIRETRREWSSRRQRDWHPKDIATLAGLPLQLAASHLLPERAWPLLAGSLAWLRGARQPGWRRREAAFIAGYLGWAANDPRAARAHRELLAWIRISQWMTLAARRDGGWRPRTSLSGGDNLVGALEGGRGAILWVAPFALSSLGIKVALADAGHRLVHLSRETHGPARSIIGSRLVNHWYVAGEERFLAERAVIAARGSPMRALRALARSLAAGRVVSITAIASAERRLTMPFMGGTIRLAEGAPWLSLATSAPILPAWALAGPDGVIEATIGPPLSCPPGEPTPAMLAAAYAERLAAEVPAHPGQFLWRTGATPG
jgi:lauroyl/myristoyl acyltransferase